MKKILHVGLVAPGYTNDGMMRAFLQCGFSEYHLFDFQLKSFEFGREKMRELLMQEVDRIRPDLVFCQVQGSDWLDMETFKRLSEIAFTVNYTFDIRSKEQTEWLYEVTKHIGLTCFSNQ